MKRLSIVIPIYNAENFISKCLDDLIKQIKHEDEIILINDGSTDKSDEMCKSYYNKYNNIEYYYTPNRGPSSARNIGIDKAKGRYVIFLDVDDYVENEYINKMLDKIEEYDLVICGYNLVKVNKKQSVKINMKSQIIVKENLHDLLFDNEMVNTLWNKIFKLDIIKNNNIRFDEKEFRGEDLLFNLDYIGCINKNILIIEDILYNYIMKDTGLNIGTKEKLINRIKRTNKMFNKMIKINGLNKTKIFINTIKSYIYHIKFCIKNNIKKLIRINKKGI